MWDTTYEGMKSNTEATVDWFGRHPHWVSENVETTWCCDCTDGQVALEPISRDPLQHSPISLATYLFSWTMEHLEPAMRNTTIWHSDVKVKVDADPL